MSFSLDTLHPYVKQLALKFLDECEKQNFPVKIYFTFRTIDEQNKLYAQGRTKKGPKVTNARGGYSYHNYGLAFDAAPLINGKIDWNNEALFNKMGSIGQSVGLEWGGNWKSFKDTPHLQWSGGLTIQQLLAGKRPKTPSDANIPKTEDKPPTIDSMKLLKMDSVKTFQTIMGLEADGVLGPKTNKEINKVLSMPTKKLKSKGTVVRYLQYRLGITVDGDFGRKTQEALKKWQLDNKLIDTGICSAKEWDILI